MSIWYGGDYNPEQWPREVWDEDVRLMREGHVSLATVAVFSWARLEPREGEFDFEWLDDVLNRLHTGGIRVDLATATASPPPWLTHRYPEVLPVTEDGVRLYPGSRQQYCPSSLVYRRFATRLATELAKRYTGHPALEMWHINNEYGCHVSRCYCDVSAEAFRGWLRRRYGTVEALNQAWGTAFWSQAYSDFVEVYPPRAAPASKNPTQLLDFYRFSSDELLECFRAEREVLRELSPNVPVTTNFMGFFKPVDYWSWTPELDIIADDSYPDPADPDSPARGAMSRDLMRSLGGGRPWLLMEQAPSAVNWRSYNAVKAPGQQRAWSYQCVARGADGVLFFQWRQSAAGAEKFHSGLVPHAGTDTRVWREVKQLGAELVALDELVGSRVEARVAIVMEWDSWWALEQSASPAQLSYIDGIFAWYRGLYERNIVVDFVNASADLSGYLLVIVPSLFAASADAAARLGEYAAGGGTLLVTYQSLVTDENLRITAGGYLGSLQKTLGLWIEEFAPLAAAGAHFNESVAGSTTIEGSSIGTAQGLVWAEFVRTTDASVVATFSQGATQGWPAVTRNTAGGGVAWYFATQPEPDALKALLDQVLQDAGVEGTAAQAADPQESTGRASAVSAQPGLEIVTRGPLTFYINHGPSAATVTLRGDDVLGGPTGERVLQPQEVAAVPSAT